MISKDSHYYKVYLLKQSKQNNDFVRFVSAKCIKDDQALSEDENSEEVRQEYEHQKKVARDYIKTIPQAYHKLADSYQNEFIIQEYFNGGTLTDFLQDQRYNLRLTLYEVQAITKKLVLMIQELQKKGVVHQYFDIANLMFHFPEFEKIDNY